MGKADLIVVGGGPAGYTAALRAARRGLTATLIERRELGGTCLNRGCIPTKAMLHAAGLVEQIQLFAQDAHGARLDFARVNTHRDAVVGQLNTGVEGLLRAAGVEVVAGDAQIVDKGVVVSRPDSADVTLEAGHVLIATGSTPTWPDWIRSSARSDPGLVDSDGALSLDEPPKKLVIIGGGPVGCEWATIFASFGTEVTVLEAAPTLLPREDPSLGQALGNALKRQGIDVRTGLAVNGVAKDGRHLVVATDDTDVAADVVLVAMGHRAETGGLGLDEMGVATDGRGFVTVDDRLATNVPGVSAAGDVTGISLLAHLAVYQAGVVVDRLAGSERTADYSAVPSVTYTHPEVASVGMTAAGAQAAGRDVTVSEFPLAALGRAVASGQQEGFVRLMADADLRRIVGMQAIGPVAGELIAQGALAIQLEATLDDLADTIHAHPTFSEASWEAALRGLGLDLHVPGKPGSA